MSRWAAQLAVLVLISACDATTSKGEAANQSSNRPSPSKICDDQQRPGEPGLFSSRAVLTWTSGGAAHGEKTVWMCSDTGVCHPVARRIDQGGLRIAWRTEQEIVLYTKEEGLQIITKPDITRYEWPDLIIQPFDQRAPALFCSNILEFRAGL